MPEYDPQTIFPEIAPAPEPSSAPAKEMDAARAALEAHVLRGLTNQHDDPSTPNELAAVEGSDPAPSAGKWTDTDRQVAQTVLGRFQAPPGLLEGEITSEQATEWGLNLHQMQQGIDAKTKRLETENAEYRKALMDQVSGRAASSTSGESKPQENPALSEAKDAFAEALGLESKEVGPALEKLIKAITPAPAPAPVADTNASAVAEAVLVESARSELVGAWPGLNNDAMKAEVLDLMSTLQGARYDSLPVVEQSKLRMRDACTLIFGQPQGDDSQTQARDQVQRGQIPRSKRAPSTTPKPKTEKELAEASLKKFG